MNCPRCGTPNRDDRRFCSACGMRLTVACQDCGTQNEPPVRFCGGCGKALPSADAAAARSPFHDIERRQLTVMFCDLVGSTALSRELDPEDLRDLLRRYHEQTRRVIARYGGFIARYVGDGLLIYFGYPHAREDAAVRAIHSGLEITSLVRETAEPLRGNPAGLAVRIGIATGLVVVDDSIGDRVAEDAEAVGETPNLAARLQGLAEPNSVVAADATRELAGGLFVYEDLGLQQLRGFDQPVRAWRVLRTSEAQSRFAAARGTQQTRLIGRDTELGLLHGHWRDAARGDGRLVLLTGEAGIGKSRLAESLADQIAGEPHVTIRYQCSPYHLNTALHPFIHQLELAANLRRNDDLASKVERLEALLADARMEKEEGVPLFAALLSLPALDRYPRLQMTPQQQKQKTLVALLDYVRSSASHSPALLIFEDLHWIDPTSTEFLTLLAPLVASMPVLVVATSRSTTQHDWLQLQHVHTLQLERLDRRHAATMISHLLENENPPANLVNEIMAKTDGVPLFIEELARTLLTAGLPKEHDPASLRQPATIPSTLQDSLMARLDQLGTARKVAQVAAAIGREFSFELLAAIAPLDETELRDALSTLTDGAVLLAREEGATTTFQFRHSLVQAVAYSSLLRSTRRELHQQIAATLESRYPERVRVEPEIIAHHYTQAHEDLRAATYWAAAALRALERSAFVEAQGHVTKGLSLLEGADETDRDRARLTLNLEVLRGAVYRAVKGFASSGAEQSFTHALDLCERLGDTRRLVDVRRGLFACYYSRGTHALAQEQGQEVKALAERLGDSGARMLAHWMLGCVAFWRGELVAADRELEEAIALYDPKQQQANTLALQIDPGANALCHRGWLQWTLGYPDRALQTSEHAIKTARDLNQPFALSMALFFAIVTRTCCGDWEIAARQLEELTSVTTEHGLEYLRSVARVLKGQELIASGELAAGVDETLLALSELETQEAGLGVPWTLSILALGYTRLGKTAEGFDTLDKAFAVAERNGERHWEAELHRQRGDLLLLGPSPDQTEAERCYRNAMQVAHLQGATSLELRAAMSLARLLERQRRQAMAQDVLSEAHARLTEGFDTVDLREASTRLESFVAARHDKLRSS